MDYQTIGLVALIALAVAMVLTYILGHGFLPALNKFLGVEELA